jgi:hypothetical protein
MKKIMTTIGSMNLVTIKLFDFKYSSNRLDDAVSKIKIIGVLK